MIPFLTSVADSVPVVVAKIKCIPCLLLATGVFASLITWWAEGRHHTFWGWALPNSIINGVFGTTSVLIISMYVPNMHIALLFFLSASLGSLGKYALLSLAKTFFRLGDKNKKEPTNENTNKNKKTS